MDVIFSAGWGVSGLLLRPVPENERDGIKHLRVAH